MLTEWYYGSKSEGRISAARLHIGCTHVGNTHLAAEGLALEDHFRFAQEDQLVHMLQSSSSKRAWVLMTPHIFGSLQARRWEIEKNPPQILGP